MRADNLFCPLKARTHFPIGKPIAFVSSRKVLLAAPANRLSRWSNAVADDFVNRLAGRAEIEKVVHCPNGAGSTITTRAACLFLAHRNSHDRSRPPQPTLR